MSAETELRLHLEAHVSNGSLVLLHLLELLLFQPLQLHQLFVFWQTSQLHRYTFVILQSRNRQTDEEEEEEEEKQGRSVIGIKTGDRNICPIR